MIQIPIQKCHFSGKCFYCGKVGHRINEYHNKKAAEEKAKIAIDKEKEQENGQGKLVFDSTSQNDNDYLFIISSKTFFAFTKNTWIGDTGASCHVTNNDDGMFDVKMFMNL